MSAHSISVRPWSAACGILLSTAASVHGQNPAAEVTDTLAFVSSFQLDGDPAEWRPVPPERDSTPSGGGPTSTVRLAQTPVGIAAFVVSDAPLGSLEIILEPPEPQSLPPVGWGHQFGFEALEGPEDCAQFEGEQDRQCRTWYAGRIELRERLEPLFARVWRVDPAQEGPGREVVASAAFVALPSGAAEKLAALRPHADQPVRAVPGSPGPPFAVEILIPWSALPPLPPLILQSLRIDVGPVTDRPRPAQATLRTLPRPRAFQLTPCDYGTRQIALFDATDVQHRSPSDQARLLMLPGEEVTLDRLIVLDNEAAGYQYQPDSASISPAAYQAGYDVVELGDGQHLCGPFLALQNGPRVSPTAAATRDPDGARLANHSIVDFRHLQHRRTESGDLLVRVGPRVLWSYYGSGQCGACPRVEFRILHVDLETGAITDAFFHFGVSDMGRDVEFDIADDWGMISTFQATTDWDTEPAVTTWSETRHCYRAESARYEECGFTPDVPEPPRRLRGSYEEQR